MKLTMRKYDMYVESQSEPVVVWQQALNGKSYAGDT
jgi:hypothetical protein